MHWSANECAQLWRLLHDVILSVVLNYGCWPNDRADNVQVLCTHVHVSPLRTNGKRDRGGKGIEVQTYEVDMRCVSGKNVDLSIYVIT